MTTMPATVPAGGVPATFDDATLARLAGMARPTDAPVKTGPDVLKINYDGDSRYPCGTWVLGQKKDDEGQIIEEGKQVNQIIILTIRWRYSWYDDKNKKAYSTQLFEGGSQPKDKAEFDYTIAQKGAKYGQKQMVVFALAVVDGGLQECVLYIKGSARGTFEPHLEDLVTYQTPGGPTMIPPFAFVTVLGESEKKKNGSITYYIPSFAKGAQVPLDQLDMLEEKQRAADQFIEFSNNRAEEASGGSAAPAASIPPPASSAPPVYEPPVASTPPPAPPAPPAAAPLPWETAAPADVTEVAPPAASTGEAPDWMSGGGAPPAPPEGDEAFDIEAAMADIMK